MDIVLNGQGVPYYHQIKSQIASAILSGALPAGSRLPSIRQLAMELSISVITTKRAYTDLELEGYITTIPGKGTYVSDNARPRLEGLVMEKSAGILKTAIDEALSLGLSRESIIQIFHDIIKGA
mgnify:CR=1 FL=1